VKSLLFVPGDRPDWIRKSQKSGADCIILDLEDGVESSRKCEARRHVREALDEMPPDSVPILVRINSQLEDRDQDLESAVHSRSAGLMIPKSDSAQDIADLSEHIARIEAGKRLNSGSTKLYPLIESARGLMALAQIAGASRRVAGLALGAEDWCLDMGIPRTREGEELNFVRWSISVCARASGLLALDTPFTDFRDPEGLRADCEMARRMGFAGKLAIHPAQVATIQQVFAPSDQEIAEASAIVAAFSEAQSRGNGVVNFGGKMVDRPIAERARQVLGRARK
jgi:citrate lyase subunit beta/citryl-CoA lyase